MTLHLPLTQIRKAGFVFLVCALPLLGWSQIEIAPRTSNVSLSDLVLPVVPNTLAETAPGVTPATQAILKQNDDQPEAQWDIQFSYNVEDTVQNNLTASGGLAGVVYTGTEFWVSDWAGDTVFRFNNNGTYAGFYKIVSGIRGMTSDGTNIVACNNTTTIRRLNPASGAVLSTFTVPASVGNVRFITFNPAGNGGAGSFYVGNFNTSIFEVSNPASGAATVLSTITAATHGLGGMYGMAYDATSAGGPYLWAYVQTNPTGGTSQSVIAQLQLPGGTQTGVYRDVTADFPGSAGLAGGLFIAQIPGQAQRSILALNQGERLVAYELNFTVTNVTDGTADSLDVSNGLAFWPISQNAAFTFDGRVRNIGNQGLAAGTVAVSFLDADFVQIGNTSTVNIGPINPAGKAVYSSGNFAAPDTGIYFGEAIYDQSADGNAANDTTFTIFAVTDSTMTRDFADFGFQVGGLGIGAAAADNKKLGQMFPLNVADELTSISFFVAFPTLGEQVSASVFLVSANGTITNTSVGDTDTYTFTANDTLNGVFLTLPIIGGAINLPAGEFVVAINELGPSALGLGTTNAIYEPGKTLVKWNSNANGAWTDAGAFGFRRAYVVRPNFGNTCANAPFSVQAAATDACFGENNGSAIASVTGAGTFTYLWSNNATTPAISNLAPGSYTVTVTDAQGCPKTATVTVAQSAQINGTLTANDEFSANGGSASISGVTGGTPPYTYSWNTTPVQTNDTATNLAAGVYTLTVTDSRGCVRTFEVTIRNRVSIDPAQIGIGSLNIYPNPADAQVTVEVSLLRASTVNISVMDIQGKVLLTRSLDLAGSFREPLDVAQLSAGMYLIGIETAEGRVFRYLTIE